jgi:uncharacterized membrane protein YjgN (DUF898 family)
MISLDATVSAAQVGHVASSGGIVRFSGEAGRFWRLLARGAVLLMCTLGIYRFWLTTDIRRYLWSNTELAGESFEYTGTARELPLGFLIAIAILVPLYAGFFLLALGLGELSSLIGLITLTVLGHYAVYRARRYRLTRTVYRGVRFHQSGSAWRYAICALLWWSLIALTAGLAYPFAQSRLERFRCATPSSATCPAASRAPDRVSSSEVSCCGCLPSDRSQPDCWPCFSPSIGTRWPRCRAATTCRTGWSKAASRARSSSAH